MSSSKPTLIITSVTLVPIDAVVSGDVVVYKNRRHLITAVQSGRENMVEVTMKDIEALEQPFSARPSAVRTAFQLHDHIRVLHHQEERATDMDYE